MLRYLRDEDWAALTGLTVDAAYYLDVADTTVDTTGTAEVIDGTYTRSFILHNAYRDSDDDLVASTTGGASIDAGGHIVVTKVTWGSGNEIRLESLLTNIFDI